MHNFKVGEFALWPSANHLIDDIAEVLNEHPFDKDNPRLSVCLHYRIRNGVSEENGGSTYLYQNALVPWIQPCAIE
jgi:hypothetical protein